MRKTTPGNAAGLAATAAIAILGIGTTSWGSDHAVAIHVGSYLRGHGGRTGL